MTAGYLKSSEDKHGLEIDEPAAIVVRQIFQWAADGMSILEIVQTLNSAGIPTPSRYWFSQEVIENVELVGGEHWQTRTVRKILANEVYSGAMIQGKTRTAGHRKLAVQQEEWIRVENTHPAIIPPTLFASAQAILSGGTDSVSRRQGKSYTPNLFKGKIFCGHCGGRMERKKNHQHYIYRCVTNHIAPGSCPGNSIREELLVESVSTALLDYAKSLDDEPPISMDLEQIEAELVSLQVEASYDKDTIKNLYEGLVDGKITDQEFHGSQSAYRIRTARQNERTAQLLMLKADQKMAEARWQEIYDLLDEFKRTGELTQELLESLIKQVTISNSEQIALLFNIEMMAP